MRTKALFVFLLTMCAASGEVKTMTLREAIDLALKQNPDLMLARLDQLKARQQINIARDPFIPKIFAGSGAAWTSGFPANIEGEAPSIVEAKTQWTLFDRSQNYKIAQARQDARTAQIDSGKSEDEVIYRVAGLFLDAEQAAQSHDAAQREAENLARVLELIQARVQEKRALPLEAARANLALAKVKNAVESLTLDQMNAETSLAMALGLSPDDRVRAATEERAPLALPASEDASIAAAIENSRDLKRLESQMQSRLLEIKGYKASRLPKVDAIAQGEVFAKYYYQNYFSTFQRTSGQLGASVSVPIFIGKSARAYITQDDAEIAKLKIQLNSTRAQITADLRRDFQEVRKADSSRDYARADLDVARDEISVDLAQYNEGRLPMATLEQARAVENEKWLAFYEAQHAADRARLSLLHQAGTLEALLQ